MLARSSLRRTATRVIALTVVGIVQPLHAQDTFCPAGYAAVADSVAAQFDRHQFVFMGSTHGWKKQHDFQLCLLSRPEFQRRVSDVLVEWGSPVYQDLVDRYLLKLEPIPIDSLAKVWLNTDAPDLWGRLTLMPSFYETVRAINTRLAPDRRIRIIGGNEPINWANVQTQEDVARNAFKSNWAAHVITEHFAPDPSHKLFTIYGEGHVNRRGTLTADARQKVSLDQWFMVGVIRERGTDGDLISRLGDPMQPFYAGKQKFPAAPPYPRDLTIGREASLDSVMNAIVYLGPEPDRSMTRAVELTPAQQAELASQLRIKGDLRQLMQMRYGHRAVWFRTHPQDLPPRP